jgi:hypothetical protein
MVKYSVLLNVEGIPGLGSSYSLDLTIAQENDPAAIFTPEIRESMRRNLEKQTDCRINKLSLQQIIDTWEKDIREGFRKTTLTLKLPLKVDEKVNQLREAGNQTLAAHVDPDCAEIMPQEGKFPPLSFF